MASIQARLMKFFMRKLKSAAHSQGFLDDLTKLRAEKERVYGRFLPPSGTQIKYFDLNGIEAALFVPKKIKYPNKILYYLHGGGYASCSIHSHRGLIGKMALDFGMRAVAINYRLAPEHPYPAALDDAILGYRWLLEKERYNAQDIVIAGDSAGGGLVLCTLLKMKEEKLPQPLTALCLSPWTDLLMTGDSAVKTPERDPLLPAEKVAEWAKWYTQDEDPKNPFISPLYGELNDLAPIYLQVGTAEILMDDSTRFADRAREAKTPTVLDVWDGMPHVWQMGWRYLPEGKQALAKLSSYLHETIKATDQGKLIHVSEKMGNSLAEKTMTLTRMSMDTVKLGTTVIRSIFKSKAK